MQQSMYVNVAGAGPAPQEDPGNLRECLERLIVQPDTALARGGKQHVQQRDPGSKKLASSTVLA